jgi:ribose 5-phosphate isomerase B
MMRIGIAADHGGWELKNSLIEELKKEDYEITDFGADALDEGDDYPDYVIPLARAVAGGKLDRGIAICGSGVGACIAANKIDGIRAAMVNEIFSAHQGVEDDNMNIICLGGRVVTRYLASELVKAFLGARFQGGGRFQRRLDKIDKLANGKVRP